MADYQIRKLFSEYPQVLYEFAPCIDDYARAFRSVLIFAVPYTTQLTLETYIEESFEEGIQGAQKTIEILLKRLGKILSDAEIRYRIPTAAQSSEDELIAPVSFKAAAVRAGLGWIGKNDVLITKRYGPRVRLYAVLIDKDFEYKTPYLKSLCPDSCRLCADACPVHAIHGVSWSPERKRAELIDYKLCNRMRSQTLRLCENKSTCGLCMAACPIGISSKL